MAKYFIKIILKLIIDVAVIICLMMAISAHFYNSMENYFIDCIHSLLEFSSISPFTTKINIAAAIVCLIDIPFGIMTLISKKDCQLDGLYKTKFVVAVLLTMTFFVVIIALVPIAWNMEGSFYRALKTNYGSQNMYTHLIIPVIFVCSFLFLEKKEPLPKKWMIISTIPCFLFMIEYTLFVYGFKTWEDHYHTSEVVKMFTVFGLLGLLVIIYILIMLICYLFNKIKKPSS